MVVHSFSQTSEWLEDYEAFVSLFENSTGKEIVHAGTINGIKLYLAWVCGNPEYLQR